MTPRELAALVERHGPALRALPGVRGVGAAISGEQGWLMVYVDDPRLPPELPAALEGVRVELVAGPAALVPAGD